MNARLGFIHSALLASAAAVALASAARPLAADEGDDSLKWTPHRLSTPRVDFDPALHQPEPVTAKAGEAAGSGEIEAPPASVVLPDRVPVVTPSPRMRTDAAAPVRPAAPRPADTRRPEPPQSGFSPRLYDPQNPDALFGVRVMRTPPGPGSQPARGPAQPMRPVATEERLGGGLAPRYAADRPAAPQRPERLAMNVDGIPSVMTQGPMAAGLDDAVVPGRVAPGSSGRDRLPTSATDPAAEAGAAGPRMAAPRPAPEYEAIGPGLELPDDGYAFEMPGAEYGGSEYGSGPGYGAGSGGYADGGLLLGDYPAQLHVESFYDDPYACEDEEWLLPICQHHGRICGWLRQFGRPYYGWKWYRDLTASAGVTGFTNATDLGINGNFGTNEYLNWAMPFWNAFGVGWQVGWRGVQSNFQPTAIQVGNSRLQTNARDQQFLTTGFFTRAFEGRGLQGGIVYDYLHDSWFDNIDLAQIRYELSYVWGYHEFGFWGASNITNNLSLFGPRVPVSAVADTLNLYAGFYRVQFGDANELKVWGGGTDEEEGLVGAIVRTPLHRSLALESTFTYVIPGRNNQVTLAEDGVSTTFSPAAWNVSMNLVWYPAGRSRRSLASPYRPLFEVADNGSMIRSLEGLFAP
jgi:hypothetical protein